MSAENAVAVGALVVVSALLLWAMARSWRRKQERSTDVLPDLPLPPADLGAARTEVLEGTYVSSTSAGDWLERVPGHGLGSRSPTQVQVHDAGVTVRRAGATDLFVPAADLVDAHRSGGMTGKYVGGDRLVVLRWRLHDVDAAPEAADDAPRSVLLDTGLHLRHAADRGILTDAVRGIVPGTPTDTEETP